MEKKLVHITKISDLNKETLENLIIKAVEIKKNPEKFSQCLKNKTLLMFFEKPSLRTRVSLEVGMTQLGGHAIYYDISTGPLGKKETIQDTAKCASRFADLISARLNKRQDIWELAKYSSVPTINALDDYAHPCQMLADFQAIYEKKLAGTNKKFTDLKMAYFGDVKNNVTYDLMRTCAVLGMEIRVSGPNIKGFGIEESVWQEINELVKISGAVVKYTDKPEEAASGVDVIYTDSWMSYGIPKDQEAERIKTFTPYQVNSKLLSLAKPDCIFMNCLPAMRGMEQTSEVIDGPQSIVFDEAENRLHAQKALLLYLIYGDKLFCCCCSKKQKKFLIALGGNALAQAKQKHTSENMLTNAKNTAKQILSLIEQGHKIALAHGNGPQVGTIIEQNQFGSKNGLPCMPMDVCGAESQGLIGYFIQQSLGNLLKNSKNPEIAKKNVVTVVTQVEVDPNDDAFKNPTKPVGQFYTKEEADKIAQEQGKIFTHDKARGGYRVVVPSPIPKKIVEIEAIKGLVDSGHIVVAVGGGGIPVVRTKDNELIGNESVIDKDRASALMAEEIDADIFLILTDIEYAFTGFGDDKTKNKLTHVTVAEGEELLKKGEFGKGSMEPKVQSCINFVKRTGKEAIITSLDKVAEAIEGKTGTRFTLK